MLVFRHSSGVDLGRIGVSEVGYAHGVETWVLVAEVRYWSVRGDSLVGNCRKLDNVTLSPLPCYANGQKEVEAGCGAMASV